MNAIDPEAPLRPRPARPPRELVSSTSHLLKRLGWSIKERSLEAFEGTGVSPMHYGVLVPLEPSKMLYSSRTSRVSSTDQLESSGSTSVRVCVCRDIASFP